MRGIKTALMAAVATVAMGSMALADSVSYNFQLLPTKTNFDTTLSFPKFDSLLGKLTKVELVLSSSATAKFTVENDSDDNTTLTGIQGSEIVSLTISGGSVYSAWSMTPSVSLASLDAGDIHKFPATTETKALTLTYLKPSLVLGEFTGLAGDIKTLDFTAKAHDTGFSSDQGSGNMFFGATTTASASGTVYYTYTAVPEATTMVLGGLAVAPLALHRRRTRKVA